MFLNNEEKNYREIGDKFGVSPSTAWAKVNTVGTGKNLLRSVGVPGHDARVLPLDLVPQHSGPWSNTSPKKKNVISRPESR